MRPWRRDVRLNESDLLLGMRQVRASIRRTKGNSYSIRHVNLVNGNEVTAVSAPRRIGSDDRHIDAQPFGISPAEAGRLEYYFRNAAPVVLSPGMIPDPFVDDPSVVVSVGVMTDGVWVWPLAWADYVRMHGVSPPDDFLEYVRSRDYVPAVVTDERMLEIAGMFGMPEPEEDAFERFLRGD